MAIGRLWTNGRIATMRDDGASAAQPYGLIENGAIAEAEGRIVWTGPADDTPAEFHAHDVIDLGGMLVTPGLIDCHTHLVYGGDRAAEFELRLQGASYEEIAKAGGGIVSTVAATRQASERELTGSALPRLDALLSEGVTTVEVKSGYGLDTETEGRMLRAAKALGEQRSVSIAATFLGAHAVPPEYKDDSDGYIDLVCAEMIPALSEEGLIDAVDGFCETIAFTAEQIDRVFAAAKARDLPVKLHAEQLSNLGGTALAASYGALSADHLEYLDDAGIAAMAKAGTVAVLLPGAFYYLRETKLPPIQALRDAGVPIAIATDANPGSSPVTSILTILNMACTLFRLTPEEALAGVTRCAARALGLDDRGVLKEGMRCDLAVWREERPGALAYRIGFNSLDRRVVGGETCPL